MMTGTKNTPVIGTTMKGTKNTPILETTRRVTMMDTGTKSTKFMQLSCETFNCHDFKSSSKYICDRLRDCDIMCLNETWLAPDEQSLTNT